MDYRFFFSVFKRLHNVVSLSSLESGEYFSVSQRTQPVTLDFWASCQHRHWTTHEHRAYTNTCKAEDKDEKEGRDPHWTDFSSDALCLQLSPLSAVPSLPVCGWEFVVQPSFWMAALGGEE